MESGGKAREEEQDGMSVHSPCKAPPSSASSLPKEQSQVELELRLLEALEIYPPIKLQGMPLLIFVTKLVLQFLLFFGQTSYAGVIIFNRQFSSDEVLQLLDRFYNLEVLKPDDEDIEVLNREEDFSLPQSFFVKEES
ncbi:hypothetical protein CsatA_016053 [Cannabis sativa]